MRPSIDNTTPRGSFLSSNNGNNLTQQTTQTTQTIQMAQPVHNLDAPNNHIISMPTQVSSLERCSNNMTMMVTRPDGAMMILVHPDDFLNNTSDEKKC